MAHRYPFNKNNKNIQKLTDKQKEKINQEFFNPLPKKKKDSSDAFHTELQNFLEKKEGEIPKSFSSKLGELVSDKDRFLKDSDFRIDEIMRLRTNSEFKTLLTQHNQLAKVFLTKCASGHPRMLLAWQGSQHLGQFFKTENPNLNVGRRGENKPAGHPPRANQPRLNIFTPRQERVDINALLNNLLAQHRHQHRPVDVRVQQRELLQQHLAEQRANAARLAQQRENVAAARPGSSEQTPITQVVQAHMGGGAVDDIPDADYQKDKKQFEGLRTGADTRLIPGDVVKIKTGEGADQFVFYEKELALALLQNKQRNPFTNEPLEEKHITEATEEYRKQVILRLQQKVHDHVVTVLKLTGADAESQEKILLKNILDDIHAKYSWPKSLWEGPSPGMVVNKA